MSDSEDEWRGLPTEPAPRAVATRQHVVTNDARELSRKRATIPAMFSRSTGAAAKRQARVAPQFEETPANLAVRATFSHAKDLAQAMLAIEPGEDAYLIDFGAADSAKPGLRVVQCDAAQTLAAVLHVPIESFLVFSMAPGSVVTAAVRGKRLVATARTCQNAQTITFEMLKDADVLTIVLALEAGSKGPTTVCARDTHQLALVDAHGVDTVVPSHASMPYDATMLIDRVILAERIRAAQQLSGVRLGLTALPQGRLVVSIYTDISEGMAAASKADVEGCLYEPFRGRPLTFGPEVIVSVPHMHRFLALATGAESVRLLLPATDDAPLGLTFSYAAGPFTVDAFLAPFVDKTL